MQVYMGKSYNQTLFWNHMWWSAQWRPLCTMITEVNSSAFVYGLFHEDFSICSDNWREIFMKQSVNKCR